jgi:signal peptide peptidase SppA
MAENSMSALLEYAQTTSRTDHIQAASFRPQSQSAMGYGYEVHDGVAVIEMSGTLMKSVEPSTGGTSMAYVRRDIRNATRDSAVKSIILKIDSPGGTVKGMDDLALEVKNANAKKKVVAYIEDLGASAAYYVAAQASNVYVNRSGRVGSIGVFGVLADRSEQLKKKGITLHVISSGEFKGLGADGVVSDELKAIQQEQVDALAEQFISAVSEGRNMDSESVRAVADGRIFSAQEAVSLGLADSVQSFEVTLSSLQFSARRNAEGGHGERAQTQKEESTMGDSTEQKDAVAPEPKAATLKELKKLCAGASSDFLLQCVEEERTGTEALQAWAEVQAEENAKLKADLEEAQKPKATTGNQPLGGAGDRDAGDAGTSAVEQWNALVAEKVAAGFPKHKAVAFVASNNDELRQAYLAELNSGGGN